MKLWLLNRMGLYNETGDLTAGAGAEPAAEPTASEIDVPPVDGASGATDSGNTLKREDFTSASKFLREYQARQKSVEPSEGENGGEKQTPKPEADNPEGTEPVKAAEEAEKGTGDTTDPTKVKTEGEKPEGEPKEEPKGEPSTEITLPDGRKVSAKDVETWEKGHMMQADYTRKTQELSEQRRQFDTERQQHQEQVEWFTQNGEQAQKALSLWDQLSRDPIGTLEKVREHYESMGVYEPKDPNELARDDQIRRLETEKQQLAQEKQQLAQQEAFNRLDAQFKGLEKDYGDKFNREEVIQFMLQNNFFDAEKAFKALKADDLISEKESSLQKQIDELKEQLKNSNSKAVSDYVKTKTSKGSVPAPVGTSTTAAPPVQINQPKNFIDAKRAALARLSKT